MVVRIENNLPHEVSELICLKCLGRWIGVYPETTFLKDLECKCGEVGFVIKTGQSIVEYNDVECYMCQHFSNEKCKLGLTYNSNLHCEYAAHKDED